MENHSKYTLEQESFIEGNYADFFNGIAEDNFAKSQDVINEMEAKEFYSVAEDMKKLLAAKRLHV